MVLWRCYYHLIWTTKYRQPIITAQHERIIYSAIRQKCYELKCHPIEINGVADHIHVVTTIPPSHSVADIIRQLKGVSSYEVNQQLVLKEAFHWQRGYGVLTFGEKVIPQIVEYVSNQKQRHQVGNVFDYLEQVED
jgi:REP element-mobilizing transposase RayT